MRQRAVWLFKSMTEQGPSLSKLKLVLLRRGPPVLRKIRALYLIPGVAMCMAGSR